jgi:hypothetical protein
VTHVAFDLEAAESTLTARLLALTNTTLTPPEPLLRSCFNLLDEAMSNDDTPRRLPGCGILHDGETYESNELLGGHVAQSGRQRWKLVFVCDAAVRDGGLRGKRGAYTITKLAIEGLVDPDDAWQIAPGIPLQVESRQRYNARDENGELLPIAGYVVEVSHPIYYE